MRTIKYIFGWVVFLEQILGIGGFIYFGITENKELAMLILGQYLLIMGIATFSNYHKIGISLMISGTLIFVISSLLKWGYILNKTIEREKLVGVILLWSIIISFIVVGLGFMIRPIYLKRKRKCYKLKISAEVIDYETSFDEGSKTYCPIYQYAYNSHVYKYSNNWFTNIEIPQKGSKIDRYIY
jgi:hypothetical protein